MQTITFGLGEWRESANECRKFNRKIKKRKIPKRQQINMELNLEHFSVRKKRRKRWQTIKMVNK